MFQTGNIKWPHSFNKQLYLQHSYELCIYTVWSTRLMYYIPLNAFHHHWYFQRNGFFVWLFYYQLQLHSLLQENIIKRLYHLLKSILIDKRGLVYVPCIKVNQNTFCKISYWFLLIILRVKKPRDASHTLTLLIVSFT
jgi:hypothetical protein